MSRSVKKTPVVSNATGASEKQDKKAWHHRLRRKEKVALSTEADLDAHIPVDEREVSDPHSMAKDGRHYLTAAQAKRVVRLAKKKHPEDVRAADRALHKLVAK